MVLKATQERVKTLLKDTITLLCKNGLEFKDNFTVEALIGVTLDNNEVMLISMNEIVKSDKAPASDASEDELQKNQTPDTTSVRLKKRKKRTFSDSTGKTEPHVKTEPRSPTYDVTNQESYKPEAQDLWGGGDPPSLSPSTLEVVNPRLDLSDEPVNKRRQTDASHMVRNDDDDDDNDETHEDSADEDLVFIKQEASESQVSGSESQQLSVPEMSMQSSQFSNSSFMPQDPQDGNMVWSQMPQQRSFSRRGPRTSTVTSESFEQSSQHDIPLDQQQQQMTESSMWLTENGQYQCIQCGYACRQLGDIKAHTDMHQGKYRYTCTVCGKGFSVKSNLEGHMSWHTGIKEFKCQLCSSEFRYKNHLKRHQQRVHNITF